MPLNPHHGTDPSFQAAIDAGLVARLPRSDPGVAAASRCLQCGACTPFCPGALETDFAFLPRKVTAAVAENRPLNCDIDACVQCRQCELACPQGISAGAIVNAIVLERGGLRPFRESLRLTGIIPPAMFFPLYTRGLDPAAFAKKKLGDRRVVTPGARAELQALLSGGDGAQVYPQWEQGHRLARPAPEVPDEVYALQSCCAFNYPGIPASTAYLLDRVGIGTRHSPEETCCGGAPHHLGEVSPGERLLAGSRNLAVMADTLGGDGTATGVGVCPTCFATYRETIDRLGLRQTRAFVNEQLSGIGRSVEGSGRYAVLHVMEVLDARRGELRAETAGTLAGVRVGIHASCHSRVVTRDDRGYRALARLVGITGARHVRSVFDDYCCGGVKDLFGRYLDGRRDQPSLLSREARDARARDGIDLVITDCPGCMLVYDSQGIPVLHIAELVAIAGGRSPRQAGLGDHFTPVAPVLEVRGAL